MNSLPSRISVTCLIIVVCLVIWNVVAFAYNQFSLNGGDATNCGACHGDFRSNSYTSLSDGTLWGNLHNIHRQTMLNGDCDVCHTDPNRFPVILNSSNGGSDLEAIGCVGCHGRSDDNTEANPDWPQSGYGAGLRQHHYNAGVTICNDCHMDTNPTSFSPTGENVLPPYYANPGTGHPNIPTSACNLDGSEDFAGLNIGLDNDGDLLYDGDDPNCVGTATPEILVERELLLQNYPNPFNPETAIHYSILRAGWARLQVFTLTGALVRTLVDGFHEKADIYITHWDGRDDFGNHVASGIYFYQLINAGFVETKRMVLVR